jgi:hypothetical protein
MLRGWMLSGLLLVACTQVATPAPTSPTPANNPARQADVVRVDSGRLMYSFRAARFTNLVYQLDCLSGTIQCSREAFQELWQKDLGGLSNQDSSLLDDWKALRYEYAGRIQKRGGEEDPGLPLPRSRRQIEARVRIAGYSAGSEERFGENLRILLDEADVTRALRVVRNFSGRFDGFWQKHAARTRASAEGFVKVLQTQGLTELVDRIAKFYGAELPQGTELVFDLVARPSHDSATHAEQIGERALVEVLEGERPEQRLDVVLHELFHYFFAAAKNESLSTLVKSFVTSKHPLAYAAYGLLNESLATTFGNAMVLRLLDQRQFEQRRAKVRGFYDDDFIDAASRALLEPLDVALREGRSLFEPEIFATYLGAIEKAFPEGLPPRAYFRPYAALYEPELEGAYGDFEKLTRSPQIASGTLTEPDATGMLALRPYWTHVTLLRPSRVKAKDPFSLPLVAKDKMEIERRAKANETFAFLAEREAGGRTFVFCATDDARMRELIAGFAKLQKLVPGLQLQLPLTQAVPAGRTLKRAEQ